MKRYQLRRIDNRNTLRVKKYGYPLWFMMNLTTFILIYVMVNVPN